MASQRASRAATYGSEPCRPRARPTGARALGPPTDAFLSFDGCWRPEKGSLDVPHWAAALGPATFQGTLSLADLHDDPRIQLSLDVRRVEFSRLLRTSGVGDPVAVSGWRQRSECRRSRLGVAPGSRLWPPERSRLVHRHTASRLHAAARAAAGAAEPAGRLRPRGDAPERRPLRHPRLARVARLHRACATCHRCSSARCSSPRTPASTATTASTSPSCRPAILTNWARGGPFRGRLHADPAARQEPVPVAREAARPQAAGAVARPCCWRPRSASSG